MPTSYRCQYGYHGQCQEAGCTCPCHTPDTTPHKGSQPTPDKQT